MAGPIKRRPLGGVDVGKPPKQEIIKPASDKRIRETAKSAGRTETPGSPARPITARTETGGSMPSKIRVPSKSVRGPATAAEKGRVLRSEYSRESSQLLKKTQTKGAMAIKVKPPGPTRLTLGQRVGMMGRSLGRRLGVLGVAASAMDAGAWSKWQVEQERRRKKGYGPEEGGGKV